MANQLFVVMELAPGISLAGMMDERGARGMGLFPVSTVLRIVEQVCAGLAAAHEAGVVHGDVKPSNLMVTPQLSVKIIDFGIARLLAENAQRLPLPTQTLSTIAYISPEQAQGLEVDGRADLYSLGCVLYQLLSGRPPFFSTLPGALLMMQVMDRATPLSSVRPDLPAGLSELVSDLMEKEPAARPATATEVIGRIADIQSTLGTEAPEYEADRETIGAADHRAAMGETTFGQPLRQSGLSTVFTPERMPDPPRPGLAGAPPWGPVGAPPSGLAGAPLWGPDGPSPAGSVGAPPSGPSPAGLVGAPPAGPVGAPPSGPVGPPPSGPTGPPGSPPPMTEPVASPVPVQPGPSVGSAPQAATARKNAVPEWPTAQPGHPRPGRPRPVWRGVVGTLIAAAVVAGAGAYFWEREHQTLKITHVGVTADNQSVGCSGTTDIIGTISTNGHGGNIEYQWIHDSQTNRPQVANDASGSDTVKVTMKWALHSTGRGEAVAELRVLTPQQDEARITFPYSCPK
jgi:serine/threonine-protein kinase